MDDGAGLNFERIRSKPSNGDACPAVSGRSRLTDFIFRRFSAGVDDYRTWRRHGRGEIETAQLGGRIESVRRRAGARFRIYLPLATVAQALPVLVGGARMPSVGDGGSLGLKEAAVEKSAPMVRPVARATIPYLPRLLGDAHSMPEQQPAIPCFCCGPVPNAFQCRSTNCAATRNWSSRTSGRNWPG
jgi:hypothetical protein